MKEKIFWKMMGETFNIVAEQDFNPDFVIDWAKDSFEGGIFVGCLIGGFIGFTAATIGLYFLNKKKEVK